MRPSVRRKLARSLRLLLAAADRSRPAPRCAVPLCRDSIVLGRSRARALKGLGASRAGDPIFASAWVGSRLPSYQMSSVCNWKPTTARRSPSRPLTASRSAYGPAIAHCAVTATSVQVFSISTTRRSELRVRAAVPCHPRRRFPGSRLKLVRCRQHGDFVQPHGGRQPTRCARHAVQDIRRLDQPMLSGSFLFHDGPDSCQTASSPTEPFGLWAVQPRHICAAVVT